MTKDKLFIVGLLALLLLLFRSEWQKHKVMVQLEESTHNEEIWQERANSSFDDYEGARTELTSCYDKLTGIMIGFRAAQDLAKLHALPTAPQEKK